MRKNYLFSLKTWHPVQTVLISFLVLILSGTLLLCLPASTTNGISLTNALFTSTSAVCVTGLVVMDTAKDFTLFGKTIIAILIQLGGLGIMTFSLAIVSILGGSLSIRWRFTFINMYSYGKKITPRKLLIRTVLYTFTLESIFALILFLRLSRDFSPARALGHAVFLSISSFCNAGFSTFSDSLISYRSDPVIIPTICLSVICGGLGFIVLYELFNQALHGRLFKKNSLSIHSRLVLLVSFVLIISGALIIFIMERNHMLLGLDAADRILIPFLQSVTCRTAGFNSVPIENLRQSTQLLMIFLMFIGGAPGSIAGGIKITTFAIIFLLIRSSFRRTRQVVLWNRAVSEETLDSATTLTILGLSFIFLSTFCLVAFDEFALRSPFMSAFFEVVSAFGTVGLSMGATSHLSVIGKIIIICVMFIGRLGPLSLILALTANKKSANIQYPDENIMVG